jgi:cobalt transporter subunit CbtA
MALLRSIVFSAALGGLIAGLFVTVAHQIGTVPIILQAEVYEQAADAGAVPQVSADAAANEHHHEAEAWEPTNGFERTAFTVLADVLTGIGFGLLLTAAYALWGRELSWRDGLFWGLAGFATFTLAPGLGLPPEVPGMQAADLLDRQIWWIATATATAGGLALLFLTRQAALAAAGVVLIALPHFYGAPQPAEDTSLVPESVEHSFIIAVVLTSFLFWIVLGCLTAVLYQSFAGASHRLVVGRRGMDQHA